MSGEGDVLRAGVVGVGSMGANHARVYDELAETTLVGVHDVDADRANEVAADYGTEARSLDGLFEAADIVSISVPTAYHFETAKRALEAGVNVLVEKPFVDDPAEGRELIDLAARKELALQVGHIERFNPAVIALQELVDDLDIIALHAERLGPPLDRDIEDTAVMDLMIHDIDIVQDLVGGEVTELRAVGTPDCRYASASMEFDSGVIAQFTASRVTQEKVRGITLSAADCRVKVDYIDQTIEIHRRSKPSYVRNNGSVRFRHENVVEELTVERDEPLKNELRSFAETAASGREPVVTGEDGLRVLELTKRIDRAVAK